MEEFAKRTIHVAKTYRPIRDSIQHNAPALADSLDRLTELVADRMAAATPKAVLKVDPEAAKVFLGKPVKLSIINPKDEYVGVLENVALNEDDNTYWLDLDWGATVALERVEKIEESKGPQA